MIINIIADLVQFYILLLFVRIIFTWFPIDPWSNMAKVVNFLAKATDPVLVPVRRMLPPMRAGSMAIDWSPILVFVVLEFVVSILRTR